MVHPSTPYCSGTPFKNFGTPLGVQYTRLKSTALEQGFLTGGTCNPWGHEAPKQGVQDEASE